MTDTSTGTHSIYTDYRGFEVMYHVSSMLPFCEDDEQQLQRKRHIGNDVVVVIFKEDPRPFDPRCFRSQFNRLLSSSFLFLLFLTLPHLPKKKKKKKKTCSWWCNLLEGTQTMD